MKHSFLFMNSIATSGLAILYFQVYLLRKTANTMDDLKTSMIKTSVKNYVWVHAYLEGEYDKLGEKPPDGQLILQRAIITAFK